MTDMPACCTKFYPQHWMWCDTTANVSGQHRYSPTQGHQLQRPSPFVPLYFWGQGQPLQCSESMEAPSPSATERKEGQSSLPTVLAPIGAGRGAARHCNHAAAMFGSAPSSSQCHTHDIPIVSWHLCPHPFHTFTSVIFWVNWAANKYCCFFEPINMKTSAKPPLDSDRFLEVAFTPHKSSNKMCKLGN